MSSPLADRLHQHLHTVAGLRAARDADPLLADWVKALKAYQSRRFATTYDDLLAQPRYQAATRFFLEELYGPQEFAERDPQFSRVVPALVRLFPQAVVQTVEHLAQLHALSETLDDAGARHLMRQLAPGAAVDAPAYARAWQATGRADARQLQIVLALGIGQALDGFTRSRLLRSSLRLMRGPAQAAGLGALQRFLEAGFEAFAALQGAAPFMAWVGARERALVAALFDPQALPALLACRHGALPKSSLGPLAQLP